MFRIGMTLRQVAEQSGVYINSVEHWLQCWVRMGLLSRRENLPRCLYRLAVL